MIPYPDISPIALHLGSVTLPWLGHINLDLRWYALAYLTGVISGWWLAGLLNKRIHPPTFSKEALDDIMVYIVIGIVLGGRLGYVLFYKPDFYFSHPAEILKVWTGGMSFHGGLLGVILAMLLFARQYKIPFLRITDIVAVVVPIGLCLGRLANFTNGELYGRATRSALAMVFPSDPDKLPRYPSQLFEAGLEGAALFALLLLVAWNTRALARTGFLSGLFLIGYSAARSVCELFREPDDFIHFLPHWITMGQLLSLPMLLVGFTCCCARAVSLPAELIARIREAGPMALSDYMARCNAHYYATRDPFGSRGDFITAPEISQIFGELLGAWIAQYWQDMGMPQAVLCEMGPGRGTLMRDVLRATKKIPGFHDSLAVRMIETSPVLRAAQQAALSAAHPRISWHETLDDLPALPILLIANEFFDALPIDQLLAGGEGTNVRRIDHDGARFHFVGRDQVTSEISIASQRVTQSIAGHISSYGGAALIIDYGYYDRSSPSRGGQVGLASGKVGACDYPHPPTPLEKGGNLGA